MAFTYGILHQALDRRKLRRPYGGKGFFDTQRENPQVETDGQREKSIDDNQEDGDLQPAATIGRQRREGGGEGNECEDSIADPSCEEGNCKLLGGFSLTSYPNLLAHLRGEIAGTADRGLPRCRRSEGRSMYSGR